MTRVIVILTAGRSGSSALAGALHQAGIPFETPNDNMGKSRKFNPKGHFEMASWWRAGRDLKRDLKNGEGEDRKRSAAVAYGAIIKRRCQENTLIWGVKSPFTPWTLEVFGPLLPADHRVIVLRRNRESMTQSVKRHHNCGNGLPYDKAALIVDDYIRQLERASDTLTCPVMDVRYEQLIRYPWRTLAGVLEFCYEDLAQVQIEQIERAVAWIDPELCHHA